MTAPLHSWNYGIQHARGIAVLSVVAFHFFDLSIFWGRFGVNLFFCISGFLMIKILVIQSPRGISLVSFLKKRFVRLYPALFFSVVLIWTLSFLDLIPGDISQYLVTGFGYLFFLGNFSGVIIPGSGTTAVGLGHMWTLALEWQLYFILALFIKVIHKNQRYREVSLYVFGIVSSLIIVLIFFVDLTSQSIIVNSLMCTSCFLFGAISFLMNQSTRIHAIIGKVFLLLIFLVSSFVNSRGNAEQLRESLLVISVSLFVFLVCKDSNVLVFRPMDFLGRISYSLYLLHYPVYFLMNQYFPTPDLLIKLASIFIATFLAYLSWWKIESHFWRPSQRDAGGNG